MTDRPTLFAQPWRIALLVLGIVLCVPLCIYLSDTWVWILAGQGWSGIEWEAETPGEMPRSMAAVSIGMFGGLSILWSLLP